MNQASVNERRLQRSLKVAVVEDDDWMREYLVQEISLYPKMNCASNYRDAEHALQGIPIDQPDVVLMDLNLPGMDGIECIRRLKFMMPEVRCLILTTHEDSEQIFNALLAGAHGYLLKRHITTSLMDAIRQVHNDGFTISFNIARKVLTHFDRARLDKSEIAMLSKSEQQILELLAQGWSSAEIAQRHALSNEAILADLKNIYAKLHTESHQARNQNSENVVARGKSIRC